MFVEVDPNKVNGLGVRWLAQTQNLFTSSFAKVWTVRSSARGSLRGWAVARRNFLEGPDAGYRGRRTLSALADHSKFSSNLLSHALSLRTKASGRFDVSSVPLGRSNATLAVEHTTFDDLTAENFFGELDIEVDDPKLSPIELGQLGGPVVSDVEPAPEECDRYAPVVTVKDAERVFNRTSPPRSGFLEEAVKYQEHFLPLLAAELKLGRGLIETRLTTWPVEKLEKEGYCLRNLDGYWLENKDPTSNTAVAGFACEPGQELPWHAFQPGMCVLVSKVDPLMEKETCEGVLIGHSATELRVMFDRRCFIDNEKWRLDIGPSESSYIRMKEALRSLHDDPEMQEWATTSRQEIALNGTYLRDVILSDFDKFSPHDFLEVTDVNARTSGQPAEPMSTPGFFVQQHDLMAWAHRYNRDCPYIKRGDPEILLNKSQVRAIAQMLSERISVVQGPPGTGKTRTIVEAVRLLKKYFKVHQPILICTYTNAAVDNLVEGLVNAGLQPLRISPDGRVKESLLPFSLRGRFDGHPLHSDFLGLKRRANEQRKKLQAIRNGRMYEDLQQHAEDWKKYSAQLAVFQDSRRRVARLEKKMVYHILRTSDVVCTTCITSSSRWMKLVDFPVVFLDEASMSTEPASLIPLMRGAEQLALIGDHKQLPPVVSSPEALAGGLGISLFERLLRRGDVPSIMLDTQYRMHPLISEFPCTEFYGATLLDGTVKAGVVLSQLKPPRSRLLDGKSAADGSHPAVLFIDHDNPEEKKDRSHLNHQESKIVARIVEDLLLKNADLKGKDIGIIAPYVAQIKLLEKTLRYDSHWTDHFIRALGEQRAREIRDVEVKTVDGFEGREKEVIIFSTVRNNPYGEIGFLADRRRMNVALTRAKRGLFVLGSIQTLGGSAQKMQSAKGDASLQDETGPTRRNRIGREAWNRYMQFVVKKGLFHELDFPTVYRNPEELQLFFEASKTSIGGYTFLSDTRMRSWRQ